MKNQHALPLLLSILIFVIGRLTTVGLVYLSKKDSTRTVTNFDECVKETGIVLESYPRQCSYNGKTYTEEVKIRY